MCADEAVMVPCVLFLTTMSLLCGSRNVNIMHKPLFPSSFLRPSLFIVFLTRQSIYIASMKALSCMRTCGSSCSLNRSDITCFIRPIDFRTFVNLTESGICCPRAL